VCVCERVCACVSVLTQIRYILMVGSLTVPPLTLDKCSAEDVALNDFGISSVPGQKRTEIESPHSRSH